MFVKSTLALIFLSLLFVISLMVGANHFALSDLLSNQNHETLILMASRIPRNIAILLTGASLALMGAIMHMVTRNKFVEPSTAGTMDSAMLGILLVTLLAPAAPLYIKMIIASLFALLGSMVFLKILSRLPVTNPLLVPLVGIILGSTIGAVASFIAYETDLIQYLQIWTNGDFSGVLRGRYELLWLTGLLAVIAYFIADQLTLIGMGEQVSLNLGIDYQLIVKIAILIVSIVTAIIVVTVGMLPFIGIIIPNIISRFYGDHLRRSIPLIAFSGALFTLICDLLARLLIFPYEISVATIIGVLGAAIFLMIILRRPRYA